MGLGRVILSVFNNATGLQHFDVAGRLVFRARLPALVLLCALSGCNLTEGLSQSVIWSNTDVNKPTGVGEAPQNLSFDGTHTIRNHRGGRILDAEVRRRRLLNWGGPVRIEGYCFSSCVVFTTLPNACLDPELIVGFHSSNLNFGPVGNAQIARYLRNGVAEQYLVNWQFVPNNEMHRITSADYVRLDPAAKLCQ